MKDILERAAGRRAALAEVSDAYRICNGAGDGLEGVDVDKYGEFAVVALREEVADQRDAVLDAVAAMGFLGVYLKIRPKHASVIVARRDELAPKHAQRGEDAPEVMIIREHGVDYQVRLGDGLSTGIFLDQRDNRKLVAELSRDRRVLNLFCYHAAFSVAAIAGGASETVSVDYSGTAVARARENLQRDDPVFKDDAMRFLKRKRAPFDLAVVDPPSFAKTKKTTFRAVRDFPALAAAAFRTLNPRGKLLACTNHRGIARAKLRGQLHQGAEEAGVTIATMRDLPEPSDFPPSPGEACHLKSVLVQLSSA